MVSTPRPFILAFYFVIFYAVVISFWATSLTRGSSSSRTCNCNCECPDFEPTLRELKQLIQSGDAELQGLLAKLCTAGSSNHQTVQEEEKHEAHPPPPQAHRSLQEADYHILQNPWKDERTTHKASEWVSDQNPTGWPRNFHDRLKQQLNYFSWAAAKHTTEIPLGHFMRIIQHLASVHDELFLKKEVHLYGVYNGQPKIIVDVGANIGFFSVEAILGFKPPCEKWRGEMSWKDKALQDWKKKNWTAFSLGYDFGQSTLILHSFEPKLDNYKILNRTLSTFCHEDNCQPPLTDMSQKMNYGQRRLQIPPVLQVYTYHNALSEKEGKFKLYNYARSEKDKNNFGGDELPSLVADPSKAHQNFEWVEVLTLDNWWRDVALAHNYSTGIFVLKIDTERHELEVLSGASDIIANKVAGILLWECSNANATYAIVDKLSAAGYFSYLIGLRSLILLDSKVSWHSVFDRGIWANCASITSDHYLLPLIESVYSIDVVLNIPKKYFWDVKY